MKTTTKAILAIAIFAFSMLAIPLASADFVDDLGDHDGDLAMTQLYVRENAATSEIIEYMANYSDIDDHLNNFIINFNFTTQLERNDFSGLMRGYSYRYGTGSSTPWTERTGTDTGIYYCRWESGFTIAGNIDYYNFGDSNIYKIGFMLRAQNTYSNYNFNNISYYCKIDYSGIEDNYSFDHKFNYSVYYGEPSYNYTVTETPNFYQVNFSTAYYLGMDFIDVTAMYDSISVTDIGGGYSNSYSNVIYNLSVVVNITFYVPKDIISVIVDVSTHSGFNDFNIEIILNDTAYAAAAAAEEPAASVGLFDKLFERGNIAIIIAVVALMGVVILFDIGDISKRFMK